jgi:hypothetical protein
MRVNGQTGSVWTAVGRTVIFLKIPLLWFSLSTEISSESLEAFQENVYVVF